MKQLVLAVTTLLCACNALYAVALGDSRLIPHWVLIGSFLINFVGMCVCAQRLEHQRRDTP